MYSTSTGKKYERSVCASADGLQKVLPLVLAQINRNASFLYEMTQFYICKLKSLDYYHHQHLSNIFVTLHFVSKRLPRDARKKCTKKNLPQVDSLKCFTIIGGLLKPVYLVFHNLRRRTKTLYRRLTEHNLTHSSGTYSTLYRINLCFQCFTILGDLL